MTEQRFTWNAEKVAAVRMVAVGGGTALQACNAVGLEPERAHLVYRLAKGQGFRFRNIGRKRDDRGLYVRLDDEPSALLTALARARGVSRRDLAAKLLNLTLLQGPHFAKNLLDDGAEA